MTGESGHPFVSRAGLKLAHALDAFGRDPAAALDAQGRPKARAGGPSGDPIVLGEGGLDPRGLRCADFGCNVGGFTDCLLQRGAASVIAVDTGYGTLAWSLRNDPRVTVRERTNALHAEPPPQGVDLVVIDLAWTPQRLAVPAALRWLAPAAPGVEPRRRHGSPDATDASARTRLSGISLPIEAARRGRIISLVKPHYELHPREKHLLVEGFLPHRDARRVAERVAAELPPLGVRLLACTESPITGGKSARSHKGQGNLEFLMLLEPC